MAKKVQNQISWRIGFFEILTLLFITLKLTKFIDWSWWWILAPVWIPFAITVVLIIIGFILAVIIGLFK